MQPSGTSGGPEAVDQKKDAEGKGGWEVRVASPHFAISTCCWGDAATMLDPPLSGAAPAWQQWCFCTRKTLWAQQQCSVCLILMRTRLLSCSLSHTHTLTAPPPPCEGVRCCLPHLSHPLANLLLSVQGWLWARHSHLGVCIVALAVAAEA